MHPRAKNLGKFLHPAKAEGGQGHSRPTAMVNKPGHAPKMNPPVKHSKGMNVRKK